MGKSYYGLYALLIPFAILAFAILFNVTRTLPVQQRSFEGGDAEQGAVVMIQYGCGSCHAIPGVTGADGTVGPALVGLASRSYIVGQLRNTPENVIEWIRFPQKVRPGVDMPDLGVTDTDARDMVAYLYGLK